MTWLARLAALGGVLGLLGILIWIAVLLVLDYRATAPSRRVIVHPPLDPDEVERLHQQIRDEMAAHRPRSARVVDLDARRAHLSAATTIGNHRHQPAGTPAKD